VLPADTIFALSSAPGRAAVAVVRISGPAAGAALLALTGRPLPEARRARLGRIVDPASGEALDGALLLWFPAPGSETGEDVAELQPHGAPAVVEALLDALARLPGLRLAEPGEFTRRAFLNGKLDLTAVEGLADLIAAETALQRRQALAQAGGALQRRAAEWRGRLLAALAELEAAIDFPDEDLPPEAARRVPATAAAVAGEMRAALAEAGKGERLRRGLRVALLGAPNAGKSTLLNALARRDAAIVAPTPGTTRDVLEVPLDLGGLPVTLVDTAGLRHGSDDPVEAEGMRRSLLQAEAADLRLLLLDRSAPAEPPVLPGEGRLLTVATKTDLPRVMEDKTDLSVCAYNTDSLVQFESALQREAERLLWAGGGPAPLVTRLRQRQALEQAATALERLAAAQGAELAAEELRLALRGLGRLVGQVDVEELLDTIFREFCIGK